ncbi:hypothetical protein [Spirosoma radiotolerans]|uniref:Uncharacterized protein n=1 Tax=Spirosoma radiotolerans TaxID=1379870 RepID=A0A0E3ZTZ1_9BACT|nr:hypothetical protein [Spirosoma radiotolerans]AKD55298.1 hypothetical protein SD10_10690 [Spirosoma radiotolerans]
MKPVLAFICLLFSLTANRQSIEERLKAKVRQLEADQLRQANQPVTNLQFVSFRYSLIPLKNWWKRLYDTQVDFRIQMRLLTHETYGQLRQQDQLKGTHQADSLAAMIGQQEQAKQTDISKEEAYFKTKYERADPGQQIYETLSQLSYQQAGQPRQSQPVRHAFYPTDLSEVESFK